MKIEEIKKIRKEKKMSIQDISNKTGIPLRTIQNWEYKRCSPRLDLLEKVVSALGKKIIIVDDLLKESKE